MKAFAGTAVISALLLVSGACSQISPKSVSPQPVSSQRAPGTASRPVLSAAEAAGFTMDRYFARSGALSAPIDDPWKPVAMDIASVKPDFVVGTGGSHATVQQAVNAALTNGKKDRQFIKILPGTYTGAVYIPIDGPPLTVYGAGKKPEEVSLQLKLNARVLPAVYAVTVNPAGQFKEGDPGWKMYKSCATQPADTGVDTPCAAVFWSQNDGLQLKNLAITNTLLDSVDSGSHQAVALRTDGDKTQLENLRLTGRQGSFLANVGEAPTAPNGSGAYPTDKIARVYVKDSYIEGDQDFVFGRATAVFDNCDFHVVSTRRQGYALVFTPSTMPSSSLGFLVINSRITADKGFQNTGFVKIGRSWDQGTNTTGYLMGESPNGQIVIRDSFIDASVNLTAPWDNAAISERMHTGNIEPTRDLDDPAFNRLWEFNNYGPGATPAK